MVSLVPTIRLVLESYIGITTEGYLLRRFCQSSLTASTRLSACLFVQSGRDDSRHRYYLLSDLSCHSFKLLEVYTQMYFLPKLLWVLLQRQKAQTVQVTRTVRPHSFLLMRPRKRLMPARTTANLPFCSLCRRRDRSRSPSRRKSSKRSPSPPPRRRERKSGARLLTPFHNALAQTCVHAKAR